MPKRSRRPFFRPYQPPTGFFDERPQASTVPSTAGFCSSALPQRHPISVLRERRMKILMQRRSYRSSVLPTVTTSAGGVRLSSLYAENSAVPGGVFSSHGSAFVPLPLDMIDGMGSRFFGL